VRRNGSLIVAEKFGSKKITKNNFNHFNHS